MIKLIKREKLGTSSSKQYRKKGFIPSVIYAKGVNLKVLVEKSSIKGIINENQEITLDLESKQIKAIFKSIQIHSITRQIIHIDFQKI